MRVDTRTMALFNMRIDYTRGELPDGIDVAEGPLRMFSAWLRAAIDCKTEVEPNAMTLATVTPFVSSISTRIS